MPHKDPDKAKEYQREVVSSLGNSMKNKATPEQLLHFAKEILNRYGTGD